MFCLKSSPFHLYRWAKGGGNPSFHRIFYFWGASIVSTFFFGDGPIKLDHCKKNKNCEALNRGVLCKGYWPRPKMVTNSFGKRKFMQPMGRPKHALKVPCFFSFQVLGQGEGLIFFIFPWFPSGSHYVPQVPNEFPNMFSIAPHFYPIMLWQMLSSFQLYTWAKGKEHCTSK